MIYNIINDYTLGKRKETKGKTAEKMEGQRQGIIKRNLSGLGRGIL